MDIRRRCAVIIISYYPILSYTQVHYLEKYVVEEQKIEGTK